jgi:O-antigen/teichoic acid export membrane protein
MFKEILHKGYSKGYFHLLTANALIQLVAFASQLFVAGILSTEDIGRIKIIQTYLTIFTILGSLGFNSSTLKLCSENRSEAEQMSLFKSAFYLTLFSTFALYILLFILNYLQLFSSDKVFISIFPFGMLPIITSSIFLVFTAYFQATNKIQLLSKHTTINKLVSITSIIAFSYWMGIYGYYYALSISSILIILFCFWEFRGIINTKTSIKRIVTDFKTHWTYASKSMVSYIISDLAAYIDIVFVSYFVLDLKEIGFYGFALTLTVIFRLIPGTIQQISIPQFSNIGMDKVAHKTLFDKYNKISILAIFGTLIVALLFIPIFTHYVFSSKYDRSMIYFPYLAIGWTFRVLSIFPNGVIFGVGKIKYNIYISIISLFFNIIILYITLQFFGIMGAAIASIPAGIINYVSSYYFYRKSYSKLTII